MSRRRLTPEEALLSQDKARDNKRAYQKRLRSAALSVEIPTVADRARRDSCAHSLVRFLLTYWPDQFTLPFSDDQSEQLALTQSVIENGGRLLLLAPRGDGKTVRTARAALWALLYQRRRFCVILAADGPAAERVLDIIKGDLSASPLLAADFPEVCAVFRAADGSPQRARALHFDGVKVAAGISSDRLVFPTVAVPQSCAAGQLLLCRGITSQLRGIVTPTAAGETVRPDLVLCDDVQTDESARSPGQTYERETLLSGAVAGLAGPNATIATVALLTCIRRGDLADRLGDQKLHPEWTARKYQLVYEWPTAGELWSAYTELWKTNPADARAYYVAHREAMDAGSRVGWEHRVRTGESSAIETAWVLRLEAGEPSFQAEYQNDPRRTGTAAYELTDIRVMEQTGICARGVVPEECDLLTVGCDVNLYGVTFVVAAWRQDAAGFIVDYGKYPPGQSVIWSQDSAAPMELAVHSAIVATVAEIMGRHYTRAGDRIIPSMVAVDCSFERDIVVRAVRQARAVAGGSRVVPIRGVSGKHYAARQAVRKGDGWHVAPWPTEQVLFANVDGFRARMQRGFLTPAGGPGSLSLYTESADRHQVYAQQVSAERLVDVLQGSRMQDVHVWSLAPGAKNDLGDATVYAMVAAAAMGIAATKRQGIAAGLENLAAGRASTKPRDLEPVTPAVTHPTPKHFSAVRRGNRPRSWSSAY